MYFTILKAVILFLVQIAFASEKSGHKVALKEFKYKVHASQSLAKKEQKETEFFLLEPFYSNPISFDHEDNKKLLNSMIIHGVIVPNITPKIIFQDKNSNDIYAINMNEQGVLDPETKIEVLNGLNASAGSIVHISAEGNYLFVVNTILNIIWKIDFLPKIPGDRDANKIKATEINFNMPNADVIRVYHPAPKVLLLMCMVKRTSKKSRGTFYTVNKLEMHRNGNKLDKAFIKDIKDPGLFDAAYNTVVNYLNGNESKLPKLQINFEAVADQGVLNVLSKYRIYQIKLVKNLHGHLYIRFEHCSDSSKDKSTDTKGSVRSSFLYLLVKRLEFLKDEDVNGAMTMATVHKNNFVHFPSQSVLLKEGVILFDHFQVFTQNKLETLSATPRQVIFPTTLARRFSPFKPAYDKPNTLSKIMIATNQKWRMETCFLSNSKLKGHKWLSVWDMESENCQIDVKMQLDDLIAVNQNPQSQKPSHVFYSSLENELTLWCNRKQVHTLSSVPSLSHLFFHDNVIVSMTANNQLLMYKVYEKELNGFNIDRIDVPKLDEAPILVECHLIGRGKFLIGLDQDGLLFLFDLHSAKYNMLSLNLNQDEHNQNGMISLSDWSFDEDQSIICLTMSNQAFS